MRIFFLVGCLAAFNCIKAQNPVADPFKNVNSPNDEQHPLLSPNGKVLYFTIANHPKNIGRNRDKGDIWFSEKVDGEWSHPIHAGKPLNNAGYNRVGGISRDGLRLYLFGHYNLSGRAKTQGFAVSQKTTEGWSRPKIITVPYFPSRSATISGYVSPNEDILVFAGEAYPRSGGEDIHVSIKDISGQWGEPKNVGKRINTPYQEVSPWISDDTQYLYFASNGQSGYGSFDIYYAKRLDDSWTSWSTPTNMGETINSEGRELSYSAYPKAGIAIYTTTKNSDGYGDIRASGLLPGMHTPMHEEIASTLASKVESGIAHDASIEIKGKIKESETGQPIASVIHFYADSVFATNSGSDGLFSVVFPSTQAYPRSVSIEAPGYVSHFQALDSLKITANVSVMHFELHSITVGAKVVLRSVLFQRSTDNLLKESFDELDMVVEFMTKNPSVAIELAGHTDNRGIHTHNVKLSQRRVNKVQQYLMDRGIDKERITGKGYGGIRPIASNDAEATRKLNRRVEFTIIKR